MKSKHRKKNLLQVWIAAVFLFTFLNESFGEAPYVFELQQQEKVFNSLLEELRCLVCQNQSLADSGSGLADDMRREVYKMVVANKDPREIKNYLVARYGNFVLYNPPLMSSTIFLWLGPLLLFLLSIGFVVKLSKKPESGKNADGG